MSWKDILKQHISYTGVVLDDSSRNKLLALDIPEGWEEVAHHMTITMGALIHAKGKHDYSEDYPVGKKITLEMVLENLNTVSFEKYLEIISAIKEKDIPNLINLTN